ncbi:MAG: response regulator [Gemmatimonadaceae bacterium]|nr:response regulator [Gemmatimonadaceae bacterium]
MTSPPSPSPAAGRRPARLPPARRQGDRVAIAFTAYFVAYAVWVLLAPFEQHAAALINDFVYLPFRLTGFALLWRTARAAPAGPIRAGWHGIAIAALFNAFGATVWLGSDLWPTSWFTLDLGYWVPLSYAAMIYGLWRFIPREAEAARRLLAWIDAFIAVVAGFIVAWFFAVRVLVTTDLELPNDRLWFIFATAGDFIALLLSISAQRLRAPGLDRRAAVFLTAALALTAATDVTYELAAVKGTYVNGGWLDILYAATSVLFGLAAILQRQGRATPPEDALVLPRFGLSSFAVAIAVVPLAVETLTDVADSGLRDVVFAYGILVSLVVVHQWLALRHAGQVALERLRQDARFRSFVQRSPDLLLVVGAHGAVQFASPSAVEAFGDTPPLTGRPLTSLAHDADAAATLANVAEQPTRAPIVRWRAATTAGVRDLESVVTDLRDDVSVAGIVLNTRDITERTQLEQQLARAQKMESLGRLGAGLAHDFNNLLAVVRGSADALRRHRGDAPRLLDDIDHAATRGAAITRQLLSLGRSDAAHPAPLDCAESVRAMTTMIERLAGPRIAVRVDAPAPCWVQAPEGLIEQILLNLALNAKDALAEGGMLRIALTTEHTTRDTAELARGTYVVLRLSDDGPGIPADVHRRLFEPFFTTKPRGQGTGLGLFTSRQLVQSLGGELVVQSQEGIGTTVEVWIPSHAAPAALPPTAAADDDAPLPPTVLIVEDEPAIRETIALVLAALDVGVIQAADGIEALAALEANSTIEVILADLTMPRMDGPALLAALGARRADYTVIGMSGVPDAPLDVGDAAPEHWAPWRAGAVLQKPFAMELLITRLRALGRRASA